MKTPPVGSLSPRLDPWVLARNAALTLLQDYPLALPRVLGMIRSRALSGLAELGQVSDSEYQESDIAQTLALRQIASLFKKNDAFADSRRCTQQAEKNFALGETICRITNKRLNYYFDHEDRIDPEVRKWLRRMEADVSELLGDCDVAKSKLFDSVRLTNGATEDRSRKRSFPFLKISGKLRAPRAAIAYLGNLLLSWGVDLSSCVYEAVESNTIVLVPKNWKTHRTIAKEPTHSLPFQLSLDSILKKKLRKWGIDLSDQGKNQELARLGSLDGTWATLDLRMASDTLALNTLAWLLPPVWFAFFSAFRSSSFRAPWGEGVYAKFSSMGNGCTFSLESLVFGAACRAVGSRQFAVYGDDIVIKTEHAPDLVKLLAFLGFRVNEEKSFMNPNSRFRESCGCDYYDGRLVTPFYLRETPAMDDRAGLCHAINGLVAATWPGPLWDHLADIVVKTKLRLVPWNEDSRSGVFIPPYVAWVTGRLKVDRRLPREGKDNPLYGFNVFDGYGPTQDVRMTFGWRSYLLWFINAIGSETASPGTPPKRTTEYLLRLRRGEVDDPLDSSCSVVIVGVRYGHKPRRYVPVDQPVPLMLFPWAEQIAGRPPRA